MLRPIFLLGACPCVSCQTLHSERALTARRADGLRMRREELLAQLHAVEERAKQH